MRTYEVNGTYGSSNTPANILVAEMHNGSKWYCVEGSTNVNKTHDDIEDGVDVEELEDHDFFTASAPINSLDELEAEINS